MSSTFQNNITVSIFGQSHSPAIGVTIDGVPGGLPIAFENLKKFLSRRAPGNNAWSTPRKEADLPDFVSGIIDNHTCGAPITALIHNTNIKPGDYSNLKYVPRPGHADYTAHMKYGEYYDPTGGGHFSGRLTAPLCIAGGLMKSFLELDGINIRARIYSIAGIKDSGCFDSAVDYKEFPVVNDNDGELMKDEIAVARENQDSVGGVIECIIDGLPVGIGEPMFDGIENTISRLAFAVPAVKGIEFGAGFSVSSMKGSENNDPFVIRNDHILTASNNSGGILGGISNGMPVVFRVAIKPTPSIAKKQNSIDLRTMSNTELEINGRHDPCIVPRAVPVIEAVAAIAVYDLILSSKK